MIEASNIPTVSITLLKEITRKVNPPRALFVDTPLGYPLGRAHDPALQNEITCHALSLLRVDDLPTLVDFPPTKLPARATGP